MATLDRLPVDLLALASFVLHDPLAQAFVNSATNEFFQVNSEGHVAVCTEPESCWNVLLPEWREYFETVQGEETRREVLRRLADGDAMEDWPKSLKDYLKTCSTLSLDRTCSYTPILSSSSTPSITAPPIPVYPAKQLSTRHRNAEGAGLSVKKRHEVVQFTSLVSSILSDASPPTHVIDVGSGRAHLSRVLAIPPLSLHVLALDGNDAQIIAAKKLDDRKADIPHDGVPTHVGSLTHQTNSLDKDGIVDVLQNWGVQEGEEGMLVALHACGDLTVDTLKAMVEDEKHSRRTRKAVIVGCCYNLMSPHNFPLSNLVSALPTPTTSIMTQCHLRLTPQAPKTWHLTPSHITSGVKSVLKLAHRARIEAELVLHGHGAQRAIGRMAPHVEYSTYRLAAIDKFRQNTGMDLTGAWEEIPYQGGEKEGWEKALFELQVFWTLRSWMGPPIESLLLLDRWAYLVENLEGLGDGRAREVQLMNLFEQSTGSLRNVALVVR